MSSSHKFYGEEFFDKQALKIYKMIKENQKKTGDSLTRKPADDKIILSKI